ALEGPRIGTEKRRLPRLGGGLRLRGIAKTVLALVILVVVVYFIGQGLGVSYDSVSHRFTGAGEAGIARVVQTVLNSVLGLWQDVVKFFDPVLLSYGPIWTAILFIALALTLGYWMFVRG
ncbi:MAG: hypothetical protein R6X35_09030, partial [Candidatus Krumholzibacteriia bacterium]